MKVPVAELAGGALDWAVAKCEGFEEHLEPLAHWLDREGRPASDWAKGGPIIERERIDTEFRKQSHGDGIPHWHALHPKNAGGLIRYSGRGPTPLIAAMRCFVASKLGDAIDVPAEYHRQATTEATS